jgi:HAMP domain-containing protein
VAPVAPVAGKAPRLSIRTKFLLVGIVPVVLTISAAVAVIVLILPGVLRTQLLEAARNPAIAFASSVEGLPDPAAMANLQVMLERSRPAFVAQGVSFVLVTDDAGHPRAGWISGAASLEALAGEIYTGVRQRAAGAMARAFAEQHGIAMGPIDPPSRLIDLAGTRIEVASHAVQRGDQVLGAVVIGIADEVVVERVRTLLFNTVALSVLPVLLAIVIAIALARSQTRNVLYLTKAAEQMSRGDLETSVLLTTNDELGELSRALERMRISLQESLERLRRRRR